MRFLLFFIGALVSTGSVMGVCWIYQTYGEMVVMKILVGIIILMGAVINFWPDKPNKTKEEGEEQ